jgi:hypothetical protein
MGGLGRARTRGLLGLAISLILVALIVTRLDLAEAWRRLVSLEPRALLAPLAITLASLPLRPWRWCRSFPRERRPAYSTAFRTFYIGHMANNLLPARGGDVLRCFLLSREWSVRDAARVLGTLGVEKVLDGLALLAVVATSLFFIGNQIWLTRLAALAALIFGGAFVFMLALHRWPEGSMRFLRSAFGMLRMHRAFGKIEGSIRGFTVGIGAIGTWRGISTLGVMTVVIWTLEAAFVWAMAASVDVELTWAGGALVTAVLGLGLMVPAAPAYIGTYEFFTISVLGLFGASGEGALALAVIMHAWVLIVTTTVGVAALGSSGLGFSRLIALAGGPGSSAGSVSKGE